MDGTRENTVAVQRPRTLAPHPRERCSGGRRRVQGWSTGAREQPVLNTELDEAPPPEDSKEAHLGIGQNPCFLASTESVTPFPLYRRKRHRARNPVAKRKGSG